MLYLIRIPCKAFENIIYQLNLLFSANSQKEFRLQFSIHIVQYSDSENATGITVEQRDLWHLLYTWDIKEIINDSFENDYIRI